MELKELTYAKSTTGYEKEIRETIKTEISLYMKNIKEDSIGNLIANKDNTIGIQIMVAAHMDEVGIQITSITQDGKLNFKSLGSLKVSSLLFQKIEFRNGVIGIVNSDNDKCNLDQRDMTSLYVDCGFSSKEEAENNIEIGEVGTFYNSYIEQNGKIISKAIDNRAGCYVLIEALKKVKAPSAKNLNFVFSVQEEIGLKGIKVAANNIKPDIAVVIDTISVENMDNLSIGGGVAIKISDQLSICDEELVNKLKNIAKENNIKYQLEVSDNGACELGVIDDLGLGTRIVGLSIPIKYAHTANSLVDKKDIQSTIELLIKFLES